MSQSNTAQAAIVHGGPLVSAGDHASWASLLGRCATLPEARGLTFVDSAGGVNRWSYARFHRQVCALSQRWRARGLRPGDRVLLRVADPEAFTLALWACVMGGYVIVPLAANGALRADPGTADIISRSLRLFEPKAVIASSEDLAVLRALEPRLGPGLPELSSSGELRREWQDAPQGAAAGLPLDAHQIIFPTSGSTGAPRPVTQTGRALLAMCAGSTQINGFGPDDVFLNWMPMEHVGSVVFLGILPVFAQADQVHLSHATVRRDVLGWLDQLSAFRASVSWAPNYAFNMLAKALEAPPRGTWQLSRLRFLVNAGESISGFFTQALLERLATYGASHSAIRPAFGMSETCSGITWASGVRLGRGRYVSLGAPIPGAGLRIVGSDGVLLREGEIGRLQVCGPSVTAAYHKVEHDSAFLPDGWFETGDRGFLLEGELYLTDRAGDEIELDGLSWHGHEIETEIERLPGVLAGHVAVCKSSWQGQSGLSIFYCPAGDGPAPDELARRIHALLEALLRGLPYRLFASSAAEVPRTSIGKIQRRLLRQRAEHASAVRHGT